MNALAPTDGVRAMLVTAGYGTRLSPLTDLLPKGAVPVANRPLAWYALDHLYRFGFREVVLNTHHLAPQLEHALTLVTPRDLALRFVHEPEILGTGGGIRNAWRPRQGETFLVMNGKYVFAPDLATALARHRAEDAIATMILTHAPDTPGFGAVAIDGDGFVRSLRGKPARAGAELRPMFYTGISLLAARAWDDLPRAGDLVGDAYRTWLDRGERVLGVVDPGVCRDAGISLWHYWEANQALLGGEVRWPGVTPAPGGALIDESAQVAPDAALERTAVGARARVAPGVRLEGVIVWPDAAVESDAVRCIALPGGRTIPVPL